MNKCQPPPPYTFPENIRIKIIVDGLRHRPLSVDVPYGKTFEHAFAALGLHQDTLLHSQYSQYYFSRYNVVPGPWTFFAVPPGRWIVECVLRCKNCRARTPKRADDRHAVNKLRCRCCGNKVYCRQREDNLSLPFYITRPYAVLERELMDNPKKVHQLNMKAFKNGDLEFKEILSNMKR